MSEHRHGKIEVFTAPMNLGKSKALIDVAERHERRGGKYLALQPAENTREEDQGRLSSRYGLGHGESDSPYLWIPAKTINTFAEISEEEIEGIDSIIMDELSLFGAAAGRAIAIRRAQDEAQYIFEWAKRGINFYGASLNAYANTNRPPMLEELTRVGHETQIMGDCDFHLIPGKEYCEANAENTAIFHPDFTRVSLLELPDYVPQESFTPEMAERHYLPLCRPHFLIDMDTAELQHVRHNVAV